jgi:serine/threonine protein phosphatase 1
MKKIKSKLVNYFIIGDLHGCYYTLLEILKYWNSEKENLIFVGDLIDRGNFSSLVVNHCFELSKNKKCHFLKGNHEFEFIEFYETGQNDNWLNQCGQKTLDNFKLNNINLQEVVNWFKNMPLKFETNHFIITHAGITETDTPFDENNDDGVLWNRKELKNVGKVQIHGHTPLMKKEPVFNEISNSWNIDTGAYYGFGMTGLKIDREGKITSTIIIETNRKDIE